MTRKDDELVNERAREGLYRREVDVKNARSINVINVASAAWTRSGVARLAPRPDGRVIGRVACEQSGPATSPSGDFYIGSTYHQGDGYVVYNWKTAIAAAFYTGAPHESCGDVIGTRTFTHDDSEISDFEDEWRSAVQGTALFEQRKLAIPPAPRRFETPTLPVDVTASPPSLAVPDDTDARYEPNDLQGPTTPAPHSPGTSPRLPIEVRAGELLVRELNKPRKRGLGSLLATLQPEQYQLVTRHGHDDVIIDGHPGTGKTIIAAHRAAYLTSFEYNEAQLEDERINHLLLIGPTDDYVEHVAPAVTQLTDGNGSVTVTSLRWLLAKAAGLSDVPEGRAITRTDDADELLWSLSLNAVLALKSRGAVPQPKSTALRTAYDLLRSNGLPNRRVTSDQTWRRFLASLPPFGEARTLRRHAPLLAALGWHLQKPAELLAVDHVIVDEAQDVMPIEWILIDAVNREERWTILGDMNQRRSDAALGSWNLVGKAIGVLGDDGKAEVTRVRRGYRSTEQIMQYANQLLPKLDRDLQSIQRSGREVTVARVAESTIHERALEHAAEMLKRHPERTVAIIGLERPATETVLRQAGWSKRSASTYRWEMRGKAIEVLSPDQARGLEWDGVVVLEPARFPKNFQRHGLLFTSLTRANRELHVVHSHELPEALRGQR